MMSLPTHIPGFCGGIMRGDCSAVDKRLDKGIDLGDFLVLDYLVRSDMGGLPEYARLSCISYWNPSRS